MNSQQNFPRGVTLLAGLVLYALILSLTAIRSRPPAAKPSDAAPTEFSGTRAKAVLQKLVGDGVPHPVGSAADANVRQRIMDELLKLGYQPRVDTEFACDEWGTCAEVKNIVTELSGSEPGPAVMMASHYDSVPAGPGASDDGAGVAAELEVARALKASPKLRHNVVLLFDEGEEAGLLGAEAFVAKDQLAKEVRAVVNVEARGTSGPTEMFETGSANRWLMGLYASAVTRPNTTSINYTVYKLLPNDTDFTVFKRPGVGYQGFNFAFIGDVAHYHTPLDNVADTDVRSIQHQGQSALAALRALANSNLNHPRDAEAVFFDLFGWKTIWWPAGWTIWFAGIAFILLVIEISILIWREEMRTKEFFLGILSWPVILFAAGFCGGSLYFILRKGGALPVSWVADPTPMLAAFWALGICVAALLALAFCRGAGFRGLWCGTWIWWGLNAVVLALIAPGVSYIFVLPSLAAAFCGAWAIFGSREGTVKWGVATILPGVIAIALCFVQIWFVYDALGAIALPGITLFVALLFTPLVPVMGNVHSRARWALPVLALLFFAIHAVMALEVPVYSDSSPERMNIDYYQDSDAGKGHWLATPSSGALPQSLRDAAKFGNAEEIIHDPIGRAFIADATDLNLASPALTVQSAMQEQSKIRYQVVVRSQRGAPELAVSFPPDSGVEDVSMNGYQLHPLRDQMLQYTHGWHVYICATVPPDGFQLQFTLPAGKSVGVFLLDKSFALPPEGAFLEKARPKTTIASQDGDSTMISHFVTLNPGE
ncbi:MAG TPA: M20/M25/M40 family metallo-hydrolase [Candidatus Acidoferrales bacterium]|nr:M20/M25/M40 family metallo-hydrolase [Candidatus Acidoferrales bacterium]